MNGGTEVTDQSVPSIGGPAMVVKSAHLTDQNRANGVDYNTDESVGVNLDIGESYPKGTAMKDNTPTDDVN